MEGAMTELAYMYFPDHYRWSHGLLHVLAAAPWGGAEIDEVHRTGLRLRQRLGDDLAWFEEWARTAAAVEAAGRACAAAGHALSAAAYWFRAALYYHAGE